MDSSDRDWAGCIAIALIFIVLGAALLILGADAMSAREVMP